MSSLFITSAMRDIIPTCHEPYPKEIISYANSLYVLSKRTLPLSNTEEIGRYHLCCYITIEHFQDIYKLPDPFDNKIPIPHRKMISLLQNFRSLFQTMIQSTPRANRIVDLGIQTPSSTGSNLSYSIDSQSYIDQIRAAKCNAADSVKKSLKNALLSESSLSSTTNNQSPFQTPPSTPRKSQLLKNSTPNSKLSPYKSRTKVVITTPILISFCNKFYIPEHITRHILQTFKLYQQIVNNSWGLLVGLVGISYLQLNKREITQKIGFRSKLIDALHRSQQGGLTDFEVKKYIKEVTCIISKSKWIKEARYHDYDDDLIHDSFDDDLAFNSLGSFMTSSVEYITMKDIARVEKWVKSIKRSSWMKAKILKDKKSAINSSTSIPKEENDSQATSLTTT